VTPQRIEVLGLRLEGDVQPGADLPGLVAAALKAHGLSLRAGDVLVIAQKVVSKAEGRLVPLDQVEPSSFAVEIATAHGKDARVVELVLRESRRIVKMDRGIMIVETRQGYVCANAGVDLSNVSGGALACLLPEDCDRSAATLREGLRRMLGVAPAVIVSDTFGRPWRAGLTNVALGVAGLAPIRSHVGEADAFGYGLRVTAMAVADELAGAAELVMGKTDGRPIALVRGYSGPGTPGAGRHLVRDAASDLFR
jgi:coenzyme F420-0:L-glutamate ligase/coenzyme F420-1:gamma-L-glutamate ligase